MEIPAVPPAARDGEQPASAKRRPPGRRRVARPADATEEDKRDGAESETPPDPKDGAHRIDLTA